MIDVGLQANSSVRLCSFGPVLIHADTTSAVGLGSPLICSQTDVAMLASCVLFTARTVDVPELLWDIMMSMHHCHWCARCQAGEQNHLDF